MNAPAPDSFATDSLEKLRHRLLDLTGRNRLLNFTHGRQGNIRIIDAIPNALHQTLLSEEELRFQAIPSPTRQELIEAGYIEVDPQTGLDNRLKKDPTAAEWARVLGFSTEYELPLENADEADQPKRAGQIIQTLMFPEELEARLRDLRNKAETAIEEAGANICYVAVGLLEWFESQSSHKERLAPLLMVPVRIAKGRLDSASGTYHYAIAFTGEDIIPNLSLREKLRIDFGLALPDLDEATLPEAYFSAVERLIATPRQPDERWQIRRQATLALFNFSKLLMYLDLDPAQWPTERSITNHPIVSRFFATKSEDAGGGGQGFSVEHAIDDLPEVHERYPVIDDADSSQHSALIDAIEGKNLVIEGPPGTGKSQTITNIFAAALAQGKRVLFVAEKLAALEVVKRRLDQAGLGDFCLELRSHKTQKRKVLDDIAQRLGNQGKYRHPEQIDADIARYEKLKSELSGHAERINSRWKNTGKTVHEILMAASRYRESLGLDPAALHPEGYDGQTFNGDVQRQTLDTTRQFAEVYRRVAIQLGQRDNLQSHPWHGVGNRDLQLFDKERVCVVLSSWQDALEDLAETTVAAGSLLTTESLLGVKDGDILHGGKLDDIETFKNELGGIPSFQGDEILTALRDLHGANLIALKRHLQLLRGIRDHRRALSGTLHPQFLNDQHSHAQLHAACGALRQLGAAGQTDLVTLARYAKRIEHLQERLRELGQPMSEVAIGLGHAYTQVIKPDEAGLREFRALIELVGQLKLPLLQLRHERFDDEVLDDLLPELTTSIETLRTSRTELGNYFAVDQSPPADALDAIRARLAAAGLFRWFNADWRASRRTLLQLAAKPGTRVKDLSNRLDQLCAYAKNKQTLENDARYRRALGTHFAGLDTAIVDLRELRAWYRFVRMRYGVGFGPKVPLGDTLLTMSTTQARGIQSLRQQGILERIDTMLGELDELKTAFDGYAPLQRSDAALIAADGPLSRLGEQIRPILGICQQQLIDTTASVAEIERIVNQLGEIQAFQQALDTSSIDPQWFDHQIDLLADPDQLDEATLTAAEHTAEFAQALEERVKLRLLSAGIRRQPTRELFTAPRQFAEQMETAWQRHLDHRAQFVDLTELDLDAWQIGSGHALDGLIDRNRNALQQPDWLSNWLDYVRVRHQVKLIGFTRLTTAIERGILPADEIDAGYRLAVFDVLAREILKEVPALATFSGNAQRALQKQFSQYDETLKRLQRERIAWRIAQNPIPPGSTGARASDYTELALLQRECAKKTKHIPLRQLVHRAGNALVALKPCFMMGPMSVAQYLAPGQIDFDLIVMDEASQMKPQDALGAIARGRQLVVVGDPKQLPPTSFFDRVIDDDEEEATAIEESESILETAIPLFHHRRLRWHYRSQHESLIAFSNHAFYKGELVIFPSPHNDSEDFGVKLIRVARGRFVNRRNIEEARTIALAVQHHLFHRPGESLGVVAMSADQRDQIERAVEAIAKDDPLFRDTMDRNLLNQEPLFIKNLENVQGDERDVIFISCTYGQEEKSGKVFQRFGPINSDVGWRRLNVLFTRSKKRMQVFSSMGSEDILLSAQSKQGVKAFKDFLAFAETGHLHQAIPTGKPPDSDFEIAVASALSQAGFECEPQVGVAGFFIDLAVRDPGNPGRYLIGIECDGATYHSAKSARDRDRLRQTILERLGWRIHRIWSTDWFRNPRGEIEPIVRELNALKSQSVAAKPETAEVAERLNIVEDSDDVLPDAVIEASLPETRDLRGKLCHFDLGVIRAEVVTTPENQRLLRPAMLEALLEFMPITKSEFVERIPPYLRQATNAQEGKYLDRVLRIIEEAETETMTV
jgi:very-short-patch-repair endonuclease